MRKLAFIVDNLGPNELAHYLITSGNACLQANTDVDLVAFVHNFIPTCGEPRFAYMNVSEAYGYDGSLIATNLQTADKILNFPGPSRRLFYVWDLEWMRLPNRNYDMFASVYKNCRLELFCRSKQHQFFIRNAWNREAKIVEYCNIEDFLKFL